MEIKFRGLAIDENKWVYGYGICVVPNTNIASIIHKQGINLMHLTAVTPETVGQFTGLTDKNGKEIYSGDIVRLQYQDKLEENGIGYITAIVTFEKGSFRCREIQFDYDSRKLLPMTLFEFMEGDEIEVVGNIFEHSELLNK